MTQATTEMAIKNPMLNMDRSTSIELNTVSKRKKRTDFRDPDEEDSYHRADFCIMTIDFTAASSNFLC